MHNNIPHEFSVALSREDVVDAFPVAYPVEGVPFWSELKKVFTRVKSWLEGKANRRLPLSFRVS